MDALISFLFVLMAVLLVVAVVGHGLWLLGAKIFSAVQQSNGRQRGLSSTSCPRCFAPFPEGRSECAVCGWPALEVAPSQANALKGLQWQVKRLARLGILDAQTQKQLLGAMPADSEPAPVPRHAELADEAATPEPSVPEPPAEQAAGAETSGEPPSGSPPPHRVEDVGIRAKRYAMHRAEAAEIPTQVATPSAPPSRRREAISKLLTAFMEEKNIRWGELVGGLLIICSSIALVISFWADIAARPFLKFFLFGGVTAALFGVGLYTERRWQLRTTSQGVLIIATLLVPLNFLAIAAFTQDAPPTHPIAIGGELVSLGLFTALVWIAGRVFLPAAPLTLCAAVIVPSVMQLLTRRFVDAESGLWILYVAAAVPVATYLIATAWHLRPLFVRPAVTRRDVDGLFVLYGVATFAALLPLGLLLYKTQSPGEAVHRLAPMVTLLGLPALAAGLWFWRRVHAAELVGERTAGISVGVVGSATMLAAVVLAWPEPRILLPVALLTAAAFAGIAMVFAIPAAHAVAGAALALAWLVGSFVLRGEVSWRLTSSEPLVDALLSAECGTALAPLSALFVLAAVAWKRVGRVEDGRWFLGLAAGGAVASLALVTWFAFGRTGDPHGATWVYSAYAVASLAAAAWTDRKWLGWIASALVLVALVQAIVYWWGPALVLAHVWCVAVLSHASIAAVLAGMLRFFRRGRHPQFVEALYRSVIVTAAVAAVLLAAGWPVSRAAGAAALLVWLSAVWLMASALGRSPQVFTAFEAAMFVAAFAAVAALLEDRTWYGDARLPWLHPWFLQAQGTVIAGICVFWTGVRFIARRLRWRAAIEGHECEDGGWLETARAFLNPAWPAVDRVLQVGVVGLLLFLATYAAVPGAAQELWPRDRLPAGRTPRVAPPLEQFELAAVPHEHAAGGGSWLLLTTAIVMLAVGLGEGQLAARTVGLLLAFAAACPLMAAWWDESVAVASALRWCLAGFFVVASLPLWLRNYIRRACGERFAAASCDRTRRTPMPPSAAFRTALFSVAVVPYVAMALYVGLAAVRRAGLHPTVVPLLPWLAGVFIVAGVVALALRRTRDEQHGVEQAEDGVRSGAPEGSAGVLQQRTTWAETASTTLLVLGVAPLLVAVLFVVAAAIRQHPIVGPEPGSFFRSIGWSMSYALPVLVTAAALVGHALLERSSRIAFASGLVFNLGATVGFMLLLPRLGRGLDARAWVNVAQVNTIVAAAFSVGWFAVLEWCRRKSAVKDQPRSETWLPGLLQAQVSLCAGLCLLSVVPAVVWLVARPLPAAWVIDAGSWLGWTGAVLVFVAVGWMIRLSAKPVSDIGGWGLALGVALVALTAARWDAGNWLAYHTLLAGFGAASCAVAARSIVVLRVHENEKIRHRAATALGALTIVLALRALAGDPQAPWWTIGGLVVTSGVAVVLAATSARRWFLYAGAALLNLAGSIWWVDSGYRLVDSSGVAAVMDFLYVNALIAAVPVVLWVVVELRWVRPRTSAGRRTWLIGVHHVVGSLCVAGLLLLVGAGLMADVEGYPVDTTVTLAWLAVGAAFVAAGATLWDRPSQVSLARLYFLALGAAGLILDGLNLEGLQFWWMLTMVFAAFSLATSYVWSRRGELRGFGGRVGIPVGKDQPLAPAAGLVWLVPANFLIAVVVTVLAYWMVLSLESFTERMLAAYAVVAQAVAVGMLARGAVRSSLQYASLLLGVLFAVAFGWAWLPVDLAGPLLHRTVVVGVALVAVMVLYGFGLVKLLRRENEWTMAAERLLPLLVVVETVSILVVLGAEAVHYARLEHVPIFWYEIVAVTVALATMCLAALAAAVLPGRDPLGLSERGRQVYVYAAEVVLTLLCVHIRLTMPWLFHGWFLRYWPLVVMAIAFVGVGLGEWLARRRAQVLSEPLQTTGALLPLLPVLGFWFLPGEVNYALLLLSVGALYATLSALRQSFLYGVLAALAANGSLWYLLHRADGLGLAEHPQLWLIPPALCVLVAAYLNREQLTNQQMTTVRYMSAIVIYVASTADIFINGVAEAPWLPLVLAAIALVGIFAGIVLRVRAFVYLGTSFLLVALLTIVWYAAVELGYAWLWWVCGIITGVCIIALFAVFEKKRDDMLRLVERVKAWEP